MAAGWLLLMAAGAAGAAGLGQARVLSAAGEPLRVRIELIMGPGDRAGRIVAAVASPAIPAGDASNQLAASVDPLPRGRAVLTVRSSAPVEQSSLDLIVVLSSPAGRAQRSFALTLPSPAPDNHVPDAVGPTLVPPAPSPTQPSAASSTPTLDRPMAEAREPQQPEAAGAELPMRPGGSLGPVPVQGSTGEAAGQVSDRVATGHLVAIVALAVAAVAGLGALILAVLRR